MGPQNWPERLHEVLDRMARAALEAGRPVDSITLLGVTKGQPASVIRAASQAGVRQFGESYLQEALEKIAALGKLPRPDSAAVPERPAVTGEPQLTWHFIGRLQSNKTRPVAEAFAWVHAVDRLRIAERLAEQRPYYAPPLNICLQVNVAGEGSKGGVGFAELPALAAAVAALPRLKLRGLMCLPPEEDDPARQRHWFRKVREALDGLNGAGMRLDTLSMGMSADLEAAILEGATIVRVGTALFGPRPGSLPD
ncbi:MAG: YggS family pyridoxal phosphate-dependent enzyme [Steroidobacteraceae bacterium]